MFQPPTTVVSYSCIAPSLSRFALLGAIVGSSRAGCCKVGAWYHGWMFGCCAVLLWEVLGAMVGSSRAVFTAV